MGLFDMFKKKKKEEAAPVEQANVVESNTLAGADSSLQQSEAAPQPVSPQDIVSQSVQPAVQDTLPQNAVVQPGADFSGGETSTSMNQQVPQSVGNSSEQVPQPVPLVESSPSVETTPVVIQNSNNLGVPNGGFPVPEGMNELQPSFGGTNVYKADGTIDNNPFMEQSASVPVEPVKEPVAETNFNQIFGAPVQTPSVTPIIPEVTGESTTPEETVIPSISADAVETPSDIATQAVVNTAAQIEEPQPIVEQQVALNVNMADVFQGGNYLTKEDEITKIVSDSVAQNDKVVASDSNLVNATSEVKEGMITPEITPTAEVTPAPVAAPVEVTTPVAETTPAPVTTPVEAATTPVAETTPAPVAAPVEVATTPVAETTPEPVTTPVEVATTPVAEVTTEPVTTPVEVATTPVAEVTTEPVTIPVEVATTPVAEVTPAPVAAPVAAPVEMATTPVVETIPAPAAAPVEVATTPVAEVTPAPVAAPVEVTTPVAEVTPEPVTTPVEVATTPVAEVTPEPVTPPAEEVKNDEIKPVIDVTSEEPAEAAIPKEEEKNIENQEPVIVEKKEELITDISDDKVEENAVEIPEEEKPVTRFCDNCGTMISEDVSICPNCGETIK